jgi:chromosome segregation ATPase
MQERNESLVCELKQVRQLHTDTERTAQSLNTRLEERMQVVEASSQKIAELSLQISRLEEENGQISSSHASLQEQHRDALDTLRSTKQERDDLQQQLIKEHEKLHNSERILAQLKDDLESANQNVRALEEQSRFQADRIKDLEHQISATNCRLGTLDELRAKETASLNKVIDSLNVELQVHQATAKKLSSQIRELEETRSAQTQEIERRENERQDLTSRLEDSKGREQLAVEHSRTLTEELATEVFDLKQALAQERRNLELASLREDSLTKQNEARSLELSDKVHTMMHLRSDLEASEVRYSELETRYRTDLEKHKRDLEERERARLEFEATFDQLRQELSLEKENSKKQKEHCEEAETREAETQKTQEELISRVTHFKEAVTTLERELDATKQEVIKYEQLLTLTTGAKNEVSAELSRISELLLYAEREVAEYKEQVFALQREKAGLVESMQVEREYFELEISRYQTTSEEQLENRLRAEIEGREEVISAMRQREEEMEEKLSEYAALQEKVLQLEIEREQSGPVLPNEAFDFPDILFADDDIPQENEHDGDVNFALALLEAGQAAQVPTVIPRPKKSRQLREEEPSNKRQRISPSTYKHRSPKSDRTTVSR